MDNAKRCFKVLRISPELLLTIVKDPKPLCFSGLPEDVSIVRATYDAEREVFALCLRSAEFAPVSSGEFIPEVRVMVKRG